MPPENSHTLQTQIFKRYTNKHDAIKKLPGIEDVISGDGIDIIVLKLPNDLVNRNPHAEDFVKEVSKRGVMNLGGSIKSLLKKIGVDIHQVGFVFQGKTDVRILIGKDDFELVPAGKIGIPTLRSLGVRIREEVGAVIPAHVGRETLFGEFGKILLVNIQHLRELDIDPADVKIGAKFEIITENSVYYIFVNDDGFFELSSCVDSGLKAGEKFIGFNSNGGLAMYGGVATTRVASMRKL